MSFSTLLKPSIAADFALQDVPSGTKQDAGSKAEKIRKYAGEFEATLLANLYKDMQHSLGELPAAQDPGADTLTDMGVHALAAGLVAGGGVGIAKLLIQSLLPKITGSNAGKPQP